jgi:CDP-diacylglycerol---glycerol-3-phosphate 3-phosphatidyltransferase
VANLISLFRTLLSILVCGLLFLPSPTMYWVCFALTVVVIWLDGVDGYVARKLNESSKLGAVVDILCDRAVEQAYWITFLGLGWVPFWVPLVVILRGVFVDGIRSIALEEGFTAFGNTTMMQSPLGILLVSSRFSRWTYAACKAIAFSLIILAHFPGELPGKALIMQIAYTSVWITVGFCVVRGLPVLVEGFRFFLPQPNATASGQS